MKNNLDKRWLLILMITSQVMLTGLVVQWIRSQWQDEKDSLRQEISLGFRESVDEVLDSMLLKHIIVPVMNDSLQQDRIIRYSPPTSNQVGSQSQHMTAIINGNEKNTNAVVTISLSDSTKPIPTEKLTIRSFDSSDKNMLLRSVRLIIEKSADSSKNGRIFNHFVSTDPDTTLLKTLFEGRTLAAGKKLEIKWTASPGKKSHSSKDNGFYFESYLLDESYGAEISKFQNTILRRMAPQFLFAILLIIFTSAAFLLTYRSLIKMEILNTLRNDFINNISHELRTPISTVSIAIEALKNYDKIKDPAKTHEYLDIAQLEMNRLDRLVSQVLNTSILKDQNQFFQIEKTDLTALVSDVLRSMQVRFSALGAIVEFNTDSEKCIVPADKLHIQGVLINLIDNSLKYSTSQPNIQITLEMRPGTALLRVRDNGPGIPEEYLSKVFDKFFRVPNGDKHNVKGYGLGLSFAYLVMKNHKGNIDVKNLKDGGCEFTLTFVL